MNLIAAVDKNWGIGNENKLLVSIPDDMKFFREATIGKVVVMGRRTLESFPGGCPLKDRTNIVLSQNTGYAPKDAIVVHNEEELKKELSKYDSRDIFVIGGQSVFSLLLDSCDTAYITRIDYAYRADAYFPNLDEKAEWKVEAVSDEQTYFDLEYKFYKYRKTK